MLPSSFRVSLFQMTWLWGLLMKLWRNPHARKVSFLMASLELSLKHRRSDARSMHQRRNIPISYSCSFYIWFSIISPHAVFLDILYSSMRCWQSKVLMLTRSWTSQLMMLYWKNGLLVAGSTRPVVGLTIQNLHLQSLRELMMLVEYRASSLSAYFYVCMILFLWFLLSSSSLSVDRFTILLRIVQVSQSASCGITFPIC